MSDCDVCGGIRAPMANRQCPSPIAAFCGVAAVALVYTFVLLHLTDKRAACWRGEINDVVNATVLANAGGAITVALSATQNCSFIVIGGSAVQPGDHLFIFRSEDGACDTTEHDDDCSNAIQTFAIWYTIWGVPFTFALVAHGVDLCCRPTTVFPEMEPVQMVP
jgi:hypothetical protein